MSDALSPLCPQADGPAPWARGMDPQWVRALQPVSDTLDTLTDFIARERRSGVDVFPSDDQIFAAFSYPLSDVRVLIVGQDPYPAPGHAMGLSFSVSAGVPVPRSLANIYRELSADCGLPAPRSGDLSAWARQGVCLLNRVLTVRSGEAGSHRRLGWEQVTDCAIDALVARRQPLVAILWGKDAQALAPRLSGAHIIISAHPSPLSARRGFFGSRPFSRANEYLVEHGVAPINWALPHDADQPLF